MRETDILRELVYRVRLVRYALDTRPGPLSTPLAAAIGRPKPAESLTLARYALTAMLLLVAALCARAFAYRLNDRRRRHWTGVTILVDLENVPTPTNEMLAAIQALALHLGSHIEAFRVYGELTSSPKALVMRRLLHDWGATCIDTPHNGYKEVADKILLFDLADLLGRKQLSSVLLITDDLDFSMPVSRVRQRGIPIARAGFSSTTAEVMRADRSFMYKKDETGRARFEEVIDAPLRIRQPKSHYHRRPRPDPTLQDDGGGDDGTAAKICNSASSLALRNSEQETLLVCRPFLLLLSVFYEGGGRDSLPIDTVLLETGWPLRPDGIDIAARVGCGQFKTWVDKATELGLVRMIGTAHRHLLKGREADWVWEHVPLQWKADLPPLIARSTVRSKSARAARRRSRIARYASAASVDDSTQSAVASNTSSGPEIDTLTPPSSVPSSPNEEDPVKFEESSALSRPLLASTYSEPAIGPRGSLLLSRSISSPALKDGSPSHARERCRSLAMGSPGVGLRLSLLTNLRAETAMEGMQSSPFNTTDPDVE